MNQAQIEWCRVRMPAFSRAYDQAEAARKSSAEYRARYGEQLELTRARKELAAHKKRIEDSAARRWKWKWGSP